MSIQPRFMTADSAWIQHIPFAFALMQMARPRLLVELGTHGGDSYCAFCQAIETLNLSTRCSAIDHWRGDIHIGAYGPEVLTTLRQNHDASYGRFSTLIQSDFDAALPRFAGQSIDVLHIDGLHAYEAVRHDFEAWKPKLSRAAVVLFHDTADTSDGFGVWRLWAELSPRFPSFEFKHAGGLGILLVGDAPPAALVAFINAAAQDPEAMRALFVRLGEHLKLTRILITVMHHLHHQQGLINGWKQQLNLPVDPQSQDPQIAATRPVEYAGYVLRELHTMIQHSLATRPRNP